MLLWSIAFALPWLVLLFANCFAQLLDGGEVAVFHSGTDGDYGLYEGDVLHGLDKGFHGFGSSGPPRSIRKGLSP